ncbi:hypothetical protein [Halorubrum sp. AJ67]|nr:hypothetical protein [Halorubrum sp. AJ67]
MEQVWRIDRCSILLRFQKYIQITESIQILARCYLTDTSLIRNMLY